jgi:Serine dehydrogenase proteinase
VPSWSEILDEISSEAAANNGQVNIDAIRRRYLESLHRLTGRNTVIYAADFLNKPGAITSINLGDMAGLMEVFRGLSGNALDLILHSPGGQAEAADRLVRYMRSKFDHVRVIIPLAGMSAATMWAMAADEIVMGKHSQLGPIDPQLTLPSSGITVPAGALIAQFREALDECSSDPTRVTGWLPTLQQYPPGLLNLCESAMKLGKRIVADSLSAYMFRDDPDGRTRAEAIADWLGADSEHLSHSRAITRDQLVERGIKVISLEEDQALQDAVLSVHHSVMHTFSGPAFKITENHLGRAFIQNIQQVLVQPGPQQVQGQAPMQVPSVQLPA